MVYGVENAFVVDISTDHRLIWILRLLGKVWTTQPLHWLLRDMKIMY
jgi:hypothetical protein